MQLNIEEGVHFSVLHGFPPRELEERWRDFLGRVDYPGAYQTPEFFLEPFWEGKHPFAILAFKQGENGWSPYRTSPPPSNIKWPFPLVLNFASKTITAGS